MRLNLELEEHLGYVALKGDAFFSESLKNSQKRVYQIGSFEKSRLTNCRCVLQISQTQHVFSSLRDGRLRDVEYTNWAC